MPVPQTYVVAQGDSLSSISKKMYGDFSMVDELARVNNIANANLIHPGQQLIIPVPPGKQVTTTPAPSNGSSSSSSVTTTTSTTTEVKKTIGKYFGWGILVLAGILLAYEANNQRRKNNAGKATATKPAAKLSGRPAKRRKKKSLKGPDEVSQIVTYMQHDDQLKTQPKTAQSIEQAVKKFNKEFPGERITLTATDKERVLEKIQ